MPRDDDYMRELLQEAAALDRGIIHVSNDLRADKDSLKRLTHARLLKDAGYFDLESKTAYRITNQGYDYVRATQDDIIWKKTKEGAAAVGGVTMAVMKDIAVGYARKKLIELGVPL